MNQTVHDFINKLRAIEEADSGEVPVPAATSGATNIDAYKPKDNIPEIKANNIAQAKELALKQLGPGKKFRFCAIYSTKKGPAPVKPQPKPGAVQDQWSYLGGSNVTRPKTVKEALEALRRAARLDELKIGDIDPSNGKKIISAAVDGSGNVVRSGTGEIWNVQYGEPDAAPAASAAVASPVSGPGEVNAQPLAPAPAPAEEKEKEKEVCTIEDQARIKYMPSFNQAYAAAIKAGCEKFAWCGVYTTQTPVKPQPNTDIPAAVGNPAIYAQGVNMALNRAKLKGVIAKNGPYTQQDVAKVVKGLQDGTIGYQLDPKSHSANEVETFTRMLSNQMLQGNKRAGSNYNPDAPRVYK